MNYPIQILKGKLKSKVPDGYKLTKLGVIPKKWRPLQLYNICTLINGRAYKQEELLDTGRYKVLRVGNLNTSDNWYYSNLELEDDKYVSKGDLIYAWSASFGPQIWQDEKVIYHYHIWKIKPSKEVNTQFLLHILEYDSSKLLRAIQGGTMAHITKGAMEQRLFAIPQYSEQRAIANCLSTWDSAIEKLTQLIELKEQRKKGLMQQLLTGKKRLPGYSGEWEEKHIEDIACEVSIKNSENEDILVLSCTKYDGLVPSLEYFGRKIFSDDLSSYKKVPLNHYAYATNHIEEGSIGFQSEFTVGLISPMYTVFKTDESVNDSFMFKVLKSHRLIHEYNRRMEGSIDRRGGLRWSSFSNIRLSIPSIKEQEAIARLLDKADQEVKLLQNQLNQLHDQKKGMMQQLLTGKKRLINDQHD